MPLKKIVKTENKHLEILSYHGIIPFPQIHTSKYDPSKHSKTSYFSTKLKSCSGEMDVNWWKLRRIAKSFLRAKCFKFQWLSFKILPQSRIPPYNASDMKLWRISFGSLFDFPKKWIRLEHTHNYSLSIFWFLNWAHWKSDEKIQVNVKIKK